ncbi:DUF4262 domain-containing protein [Rhodococcus sp. NPDC054953]
MRRTIERYGWALQYVESTVDRSGVHPAYCYTVGLTGHGLPELVITGRVSDQSAVVLSELGSVLLDGSRLGPGDEVTVGGLDVCLVEVRECEFWLLRAVEHHGRIRALQVVWADCQGRYPWEGAHGSTEWTGAVAHLQPLLGPPPGGIVVPS